MLRSVDDPEGGWGQFSLLFGAQSHSHAEEMSTVHLLGDGCGEAWAQHHHASLSPAARGSGTLDAGGQQAATSGVRAHATCRREGTLARV